jgi:hypothetical protein
MSEPPVRLVPCPVCQGWQMQLAWQPMDLEVFLMGLNTAMFPLKPAQWKHLLCRCADTEEA